MPQSGWTGLSYPFRINSRGSFSMSTTSPTDASHIAESIEQILHTEFLERPMEGAEVYSSIIDLVFEPNDETLQEVLKNRIADDLDRLEPRIEIDPDDITFEVQDNGVEQKLYAILTYKVLQYDTYFTSKVEVGEVINE